MVLRARSPRTVALPAIALIVGLMALTVGCSGENPYQAAESANSVTVDTASSGDAASGEDGIANNDFIPDENLSSCIGTLQRPDCGSPEKGGWRMYLVFAVLMSGMGFIGWRIARSVRSRDAILNDTERNDMERNDTERNDTERV